MGRLVVGQQQRAFPEPDHQPELEAQKTYEKTRSGGERQGSTGTADEGIGDGKPAAGQMRLWPTINKDAENERLAMAEWVRRGQKGARPSTPAIDALRTRPGMIGREVPRWP